MVFPGARCTQRGTAVEGQPRVRANHLATDHLRGRRTAVRDGDLRQRDGGIRAARVIAVRSCVPYFARKDRRMENREKTWLLLSPFSCSSLDGVLGVGYFGNANAT